jgi:hypothetical protein
MAATFCGIEALLQETICLERNLQEYTNFGLVSQSQISRKLLGSEEVQGPNGETESLLKISQQAQTRCQDPVKAQDLVPPVFSQSDKIRIQIQAGINRRDDEFLRIFFEEKTKSSGSLTSQEFTSVLKELGILLTKEEIAVLFRTMDVDKNGVLDLDEFKRAVRFPSTMEQLISTLPITQVFADAVLAMTGGDHLRQFGQITPDKIEDICNEAMPFLKFIMLDAVKKTEASFKTMDESKANQSASSGVKFEVPPEMSAGTVGDFHGGLTGRIGEH